MKTDRKSPIFSAIIVLFCIVSSSYSEFDSKPWERLGLSITEWKLIQDNNMPMTQVEKLLMDGIGISEYFDKPWVKLHITEEKWVSLRRTGLTSAEIKQQMLIESGDYVKIEQPAANSFEDHDASEENRQLFTSFFAPGVLQLRDSRQTTGRVMIGLAAVSVAGTVALSIAKKQFIPVPLLTILIPDMVWSMVNQKNYTKNELK